jgi:hypothetical protein
MNIAILNGLCFLTFVGGSAAYLLCLHNAGPAIRFRIVIMTANYALKSATWAFIYILSVSDERLDYVDVFGPVSLQLLLFLFYVIYTVLEAVEALKMTYAHLPRE